MALDGPGIDLKIGKNIYKIALHFKKMGQVSQGEKKILTLIFWGVSGIHVGGVIVKRLQE